MKIKTIKVAEIKADSEKNIISGYASFFDNRDSHGDVVVRGAFKKTLQENKDRIKVLWQHNMYEPIGIPKEIFEDTKGLYTESKISQTDIGKKAMILTRDKVIKEMSIGYFPIKEKYVEEEKSNYLKEIKLLEYSLVTLASNELANITDVKHFVNQYAYSQGNVLDILIDTLVEKVKALNINNEPKKITHIEEIKSLEEENKVIDELLKQLKRSEING